MSAQCLQQLLVPSGWGKLDARTVLPNGEGVGDQTPPRSRVLAFLGGSLDIIVIRGVFGRASEPFQCSVCLYNLYDSSSGLAERDNRTATSYSNVVIQLNIIPKRWTMLQMIRM